MKKLSLVLVAILLLSCSCKTAENAEAKGQSSQIVEEQPAASPATGIKSSPKVQGKPLVQTNWMLTHINGESIGAAPVEASIAFNEEGGVSGTLGCNTFFGTYYVKKDKMSIDYTGATKKLCSEMSVEKKYIAALKSDITHYTIHDSELTIYTKNQEVLRFHAAE